MSADVMFVRPYDRCTRHVARGEVNAVWSSALLAGKQCHTDCVPAQKSRSAVAPRQSLPASFTRDDSGEFSSFQCEFRVLQSVGIAFAVQSVTREVTAQFVPSRVRRPSAGADFRSFSIVSVFCSFEEIAPSIPRMIAADVHITEVY